MCLCAELLGGLFSHNVDYKEKTRKYKLELSSYRKISCLPPPVSLSIAQCFNYSGFLVVTGRSPQWRPQGGQLEVPRKASFLDPQFKAVKRGGWVTVIGDSQVI